LPALNDTLHALMFGNRIQGLIQCVSGVYAFSSTTCTLRYAATIRLQHQTSIIFNFFIDDNKA